MSRFKLVNIFGGRELSMLEVVSRIEGKQLYLEIHGVLDYATIGMFNDKIDVTELENVIIDFANMEFTDSTGIGAILEVIYSASENKARVELKGMNENVKSIFETVGVFEILQTLQKGV